MSVPDVETKIGKMIRNFEKSHVNRYLNRNLELESEE